MAQPLERSVRACLLLLLLAGCQPQSEADRFLSKGEAGLGAGDAKAARAHFEQAYKLSSDAGDHLGLARSIGSIGVTFSIEGDYRSALPSMERAVALLAAEGGSSPKVLFVHAMAASNLGALLSDLGDLAGATDVLVSAREMQAEVWGRIKWNVASPVDGLSAQHLRALIAQNLAATYRRRGDPSTGVSGLLEVLDEGLVLDRDLARMELALALLEMGRAGEARSSLEKPDKTGDSPVEQKIKRTLPLRFRLVQARVLLASDLPRDSLAILDGVDSAGVSLEQQSLLHFLRGEALSRSGHNADSAGEYDLARAQMGQVLELVPRERHSAFLRTTSLGIPRRSLLDDAPARTSWTQRTQ